MRPSSRKAVTVQATNNKGTVIEDRRHVTADGQGLELLMARGQAEQSTSTPILFLHGSYHGAWCYRENFLPYFAERGYSSVYAVSMRGQGMSDVVVGQLVAGTLDSHAQDIADLVAMLPSPPIIVAHSFSGLIMMKYLLLPNLPKLAGIAFLSSVPPSGNGRMVTRFLLKDPLLAFRVTWGFIAKSFIKSKESCRELFFSADLPESLLDKYQKQLAVSVRLIDLQDVNKQVPLANAPATAPPVFVLGGKSDVVVDAEAVEETAAYFGVKPLLLDDVAHDCMLDTRWEKVAGLLDNWIQTLKGVS